MNKPRSDAKTCELICSRGKVAAKVGDRFRAEDANWVIVAFGEPGMYSPSTLGGTPSVFAKPDTPPRGYERYGEEDGTVEWCGDSVASRILSEAQ